MVEIKWTDFAIENLNESRIDILTIHHSAQLLENLPYI